MNGYIENKTFDEIKVGDSAELQHTLTNHDIQLFAIMSGDVNPAHVDKEYAKSDMFHKIIAHGMWGGSLISTVLGTQLPGPGTIYLSQTFKFLRPVAIGDEITARVTVKKKDKTNNHITFDCVCLNQSGKEVITGVAEILAPTEKVSRQTIKMPHIEFSEEPSQHDKLIDMAKGLKPLITAIVHPVDALSLKGAIATAEAGIIIPILVGPEAKIKAVAKAEGIDISKYKIVAVPHSDAAAEKAVEMVHKGIVESIMKGSLHTEELMHPIVNRDSGLQTGRRMSHVAVLDVPLYPRPLFLTDAAINTFPNLSEKMDIVQNAIDLFVTIELGTPRVALLSAIETINERIPSTLDAAALCKMAERMQITGAILDGPLAFDNAMSADAAKVKGIASQVAGKPDILLVPDLESGNMLMKQLTLFSGATMAGIVMGARVPIILTSRSSDELSRIASCALALMYCRKKKKI